MLQLSTLAGIVPAMPQKKSGYHHGDLRRALLDHALRLFAERGSFAFSLRELAQAAGVTHNAPYRHFRSKGELLGAVRAEGLAKLGKSAARAHARGGDARARVRALGEAYIRFALASPHHFRLVLHNPLTKSAEPAAEAYALLERCLEEGRQSGAVRSDRSARELALVAWSLVHGLASLLVTGQVPASRARLARYTALLDDVFFDGARCSPADSRR
jgi:AcrR family transcriptional regulator